MKKLYLLFLTLCFALPAYAGVISHTDYTAGSVITAAGQNANENTIVNEFNGNINSANIAANGVATSNIAANAVTYAKLSTGGEKLFSYRKPVLVWTTTGTVTIEGGLDGTSGDSVVVFPDGTVRTDSTAAHRVLDITRVANFTSGTIQSGLYTGTVAANTWYAVYAVQSLANSTDLVAVASTVLPTQSNYATLNSNLGTNTWSYLGLIRYGDQASSTTVILPFVQSGNETKLYNTLNLSNLQVGPGNQPGILLAQVASASTLAWAYATGTSGQVLPNNILLGTFPFCLPTGVTYSFTDNVTGTVQAKQSNASGASLMIPLNNIPVADGVKITGGSASPFDILFSGWTDNALGVGSNPFL